MTSSRSGLPARARPDQPFTVTVTAYDFQGKASPAAGVELGGEGFAAAVTGADGRASVTATAEGRLRLRGSRGADIPTAPTSVCVSADARACEARRGERIVGRNRADSIEGTRGADTVLGRGGSDTIDVRLCSEVPCTSGSSPGG